MPPFEDRHTPCMLAETITRTAQMFGACPRLSQRAAAGSRMTRVVLANGGANDVPCLMQTGMEHDLLSTAYVERHQACFSPVDVIFAPTPLTTRSWLGWHDTPRHTTIDGLWLTTREYCARRARILVVDLSTTAERFVPSPSVPHGHLLSRGC